MDMGTFALGCMNYELNRDNGRLPQHDQEFQAETGLWAETKQNSAFRKNTTMWRGVIGGGVIAALVESFWGMFTN